MNEEFSMPGQMQAENPNLGYTPRFRKSWNLGVLKINRFINCTDY